MRMKTTQEFIEDSIAVHGDRYDYSCVEYKGSRNKVRIICKIHGEWEQEAASHLMGYGCKRCRDDKKRMTTDEFISKSIEVHGNRYSYDRTQYITANEKVIITCKSHGDFLQIPSGHLSGKGCKSCQSYDNETFIQKARLTHGKKYDYSFVDYGGYNSMILIKCPKHGDFSQRANSHLSGCGCPGCSSSNGESLIEKILISNSVKFKRQYKFKECKNKRYLPFDFYLPDDNLVIEYQGIQHYRPVKWDSAWTTEKMTRIFENTINNDSIKRKF